MLANGNIEVGVHIADVSQFVLPDTLLDIEARSRSTTVYALVQCFAVLICLSGCMTAYSFRLTYTLAIWRIGDWTCFQRC